MATSLVSQWGRYSFPAGATGLAQFSFVTLNSSGQLVVPAAGALCMVLDDAPPLLAGAPGPYVVGVYYGCVFEGVIKVQAGAAITPLEVVTTDANGHAVVAATTNTINGVALAAGNSGDLVPIRVSLSGAIHP
jgi:hypothetical protein